MFENIMKFFKKISRKDKTEPSNSKDAAKERLHLVLMQDRANVSADFLELMKQEIIEVIKKYIDVDEGAIDVRLTNKENDDGTNGAPALYANIPIINIKNDIKKLESKEEKNNEELEIELKKEGDVKGKEEKKKTDENKKIEKQQEVEECKEEQAEIAINNDKIEGKTEQTKRDTISEVKIDNNEVKKKKKGSKVTK